MSKVDELTDGDIERVIKSLDAAIDGIEDMEAAIRMGKFDEDAAVFRAEVASFCRKQETLLVDIWRLFNEELSDRSERQEAAR